MGGRNDSGTFRRRRRPAVRAAAALGAALAVLSLAGAAGGAGAAATLSEGAKKAVFTDSPQKMEQLAASNPLEFMRIALRWTDANVIDYTCQLQKQEKIDGELQKTETMQMKFRANVFSVYLKWIAEPSKGQEVIYVDGKNDGKTVVHPSGFLGLLMRRVSLDPAGKTAMKHSRRPITSAGMANMLRLVIPQCEKALAAGDLTLTYEGLRTEGGRPAYVFKRVLPNKNDYPCPVLVIYLDQQFLTCVRTDAYDWDGSLLSQYIYSDITINPVLTDADFDPDNRDYNFRIF